MKTRLDDLVYKTNRHCECCEHALVSFTDEPCKSCMVEASGFEKKKERTFFMSVSCGRPVCYGCTHSGSPFSDEPCKSCVAPPSNFEEEEDKS